MMRSQVSRILVNSIRTLSTTQSSSSKLVVDVQETANPLTEIFWPGVPVTGEIDKKVHFECSSTAASSPLATRLFQINGVRAVSFGEAYVGVTKMNRDLKWSEIEGKVSDAIKEFFASGSPLFTEQEVKERPIVHRQAPAQEGMEQLSWTALL